MIKFFMAFLLMMSIIGCSSKGEEPIDVKPKLVLGGTLQNLTLNDQFEKPHTIKADTQKIVFAFSKDVAHTCNDFFVTKEADYLAKNHTQFIADVSAAPSLVRSMFIMPGLKDFKHTVLILDDETKAAPFRKDAEVEKIIIVTINNGTITTLNTLSTAKELQEAIENTKQQF